MRKILTMMLLAGASLTPACTTLEGDTGDGDGDVLTCSDGYSDCGGACTDLTGDGFNCGACGTTCAAGQVCSTGTCQSSCTEPGRTQCESSCVDVLTNPSHCGSCGVSCTAGQACQSGMCVSTILGSGGGGTGTGGTGSGGVGTNSGGSNGTFSTEVVIEEGDVGQCEVDGIVESTHPGFGGSGYLNSDNASGASIEWAVDVGQAGTYTLEFTYANGSDDRPGDILVGGASAASGVSFPSTSAWTTWSSVTSNVTLTAGENRIVLSASSAAGLANIDSIKVSGAAVNAMSCDGNPGSGGSNPGTGGSNPGTGGSSGGSDLADEWPCDGPTSAYDYVVNGSGNSHTVNGSGNYSYQDAILNALGNGNRSVLVLSSGNVSSATQVRIFNNTVFNVCGTINVTNDGGSGDRAPAYARGASGIKIPHFNLTGSAAYGMFFREVSDLHLGEININGTGGLGIRIDNNPNAANCYGRCNHVTNIRLDTVSVSNTGGHGVETYGVDGLTIGTVTARNTTNAGLLLNATINATVEMVDGEDVATGNGYATFRVANEAGKIGDTWPAGNIHVGTVRARRGGRGIFCVSDSGGTTIDNVDIADTGNDSMLLENCHSMRVATNSGTVTNGGGIWITQRDDEHTPSSNVTVQNLTANGISIGESKCGSGNLICNISGNASVSGCSGTVQASCP